jgi:hypothetical protein
MAPDYHCPGGVIAPRLEHPPGRAKPVPGKVRDGPGHLTNRAPALGAG